MRPVGRPPIPHFERVAAKRVQTRLLRSSVPIDVYVDRRRRTVAVRVVERRDGKRVIDVGPEFEFLGRYDSPFSQPRFRADLNAFLQEPSP